LPATIENVLKNARVDMDFMKAITIPGAPSSSRGYSPAE
jgi:hypothetical protein